MSTRRKIFSVSVVLAAVAWAPAALADEDSSAAPRARRVWYGYEILAVDGGAMAAMLSATALASSNNALNGGTTLVGVTGLTAYSLGGPIVHWAHGHVGRGFASLGVRAGFSLAGAASGAFFGSSTYGYEGNEDFPRGGVVGAIVGFFVGAVAASVFDAAVFAYDDAPVEPPSQPTAGALRLSLPSPAGWSSPLVGLSF